MQHQWLEGNLPITNNVRCMVCEKQCGSVLRLQDFKCLWCSRYIHAHCLNCLTTKSNWFKCDLGVYKVSILTPISITKLTNDGYLCATSKPQNSSPLVVFVNSRSGDNQVSVAVESQPSWISLFTISHSHKGRKISAQV
jgi:diacylglycerol kinase (ATP)